MLRFLIILLGVLPALVACGADDELADEDSTTTEASSEDDGDDDSEPAGPGEDATEEDDEEAEEDDDPGPAGPTNGEDTEDDDPGTPSGEVSDEFCAHATEVKGFLRAFAESGSDFDPAALDAAVAPLIRLGELAPSGEDDYALVADGLAALADFLADVDPEDPSTFPQGEPPFDEPALDAAADRIEATVNECGISFED